MLKNEITFPIEKG